MTDKTGHAVLISSLALDDLQQTTERLTAENERLRAENETLRKVIKSAPQYGGGVPL